LRFLDSFNPKKLIWEVIVTRLSNEELMKNERAKTLETTSIENNITIQKVAYTKIEKQECRYLQLL
jgi:hypothetical protein